MKVSVLVPIYNVEKYLGKCLQSLTAQTLQDIEILCINDGSTDSSRMILETFKQNDPRIKIIDKPNTGYGNSMNIGLNNAKGKYIAIVESDDYIEPDMMEQLYEKAEKNHLEVIKSNCYFYSEELGESRNQYIHIFDDMTLQEELSPLERYQLFFKMQTIWSALYGKEFLENNNIHFNETPGASYQDVSFAFQVYACAQKVMLIPDAYYHYRVDNLNSSVKSPNKVFCICDELDKIDSFISTCGKDQKKLRVIASRLGYRVLFESYNNLAEPFQYALYIKIIDYLKKYKESGLIVEGVWDKTAITQVQKILDNPEQYFIASAKSYKDERLFSSICINQRIYIEAILKRILSSEKIVIYGAGKIGRRFLDYLQCNGCAKENIYFAVTNMEENTPFLEGIPVSSIDAFSEQKSEILVVLAVKEQTQIAIAEALQKAGYTNVCSLDSVVRKYINI